MRLATYIALLTLLTFSQAYGIVIRHDIDDKKYQELGEQYTSSVAFVAGCVSTLIEPNWLLTAAHCVTEGRSDLDIARHLEAEYPVEKIYRHPSKDIALVQLSEPITNGKPVKLYTNTDEAGKTVVLVGNGSFGNGLDGVTVKDGKIRGANSTVIETRPNNLVFLFDAPDTALSLEGISGPGDSGGPAFLEIENILYVAGVSSAQGTMGLKEGQYGVKEYYSRVSTHYSWIREIIDNTRPNPVPGH